jgi:hypothetical protein
LTGCGPVSTLVFEQLFRYDWDMFTTGLRAARDLLREALASVRAGAVPDDSSLRDALELSRELARLVSQVQVEAVAALERSGAFAAAGYRRPDSAVANVLTVERGRARAITRAAAQVCPRVDLQGQVMPAALPATAVVFAAGAASLAHVEVIGRLLDGLRHDGCHRRSGPESRSNSRRTPMSTRRPSCGPGVPG